MLRKVGSTLRSHWKKTLVLGGLVSWGGKLVYNEMEDNKIRKNYAEIAKQLGEQPMPADAKPKKIVVFLNVNARHGKAKRLFEKNCEPLLHLAGYDLRIVYNDQYDFNQKTFNKFVNSEDKDNLHSVIIAGGNKTIQQIITCFMHSEDQSIKEVPIGVLPLGFKNSSLKLIDNGERSDNIIEWQASSCMNIIKGERTKTLDIMRVNFLPRANVPDDEIKSVYALRSMKWGAYREAEWESYRYWYLAPLKSYFSFVKYVFAQRKSWPPTVRAQLDYVDVCPGCQRCISKHEKERLLSKKKQASRSAQTSGGSGLLGWIGIGSKAENPATSGVPVPQSLPQHERPGCGAKESLCCDTLELRAFSSNVDDNEEDRSLIVTLSDAEIGRMAFVSNGVRRVRAASSKVMRVESLAVRPLENTMMMYYIDGENYPAREIEVDTIPAQLRLFTK